MSFSASGMDTKKPYIPAFIIFSQFLVQRKLNDWLKPPSSECGVGNAINYIFPFFLLQIRKA